MPAKAAAVSTLSRLVLAFAASLAVVAIGAGPALSATGSGGDDLITSLLPGETADLTGTTDADPTYSRTITWNVAKAVDPARQNIPTGGSATFDYTVTVTHDDGTDSGWVVIGQINVSNPNNAPVENVVVSDAIDDPNATCIVSGGSSTIPAEGQIAFDYTCTYSAAPASANETNTATISWPEQKLAGSGSLPAGSALASTAVAWGDPTFILNSGVEVGDSLFGELGSVLYTDPSSTTFTYPFTFDDVPAGTCTSFDNTAFVTNDSVLASAGATVEICTGGSDLTVTTTATSSFTRTFGWDVKKSVDRTSQTIASGGTAIFDYAVDVSKDAGVDSDWATTGTITVTNPNSWEIDVSLADNAPGGDCSLDRTSVRVPANGSVSVGYTCTFASGGPGTNTATASWDSQAYTTPSGSSSATADYAFESPTKLVDDSVGVYDNGTLLGTTDHSTGYTYSKTFAGVAGTCTGYDNTATVETETAVLALSDTVTATVCVNEDLAISSTASPSFARTYNWKIAKSVAAPATVTKPAGGTATFNYTVNTSGDGYTDSGWQMSGKITVTNPNDSGAITADVTDAVDNGGVCAVAQGMGVSVPANGSVALDYVCTYAAAPTPSGGVNSATATWNTSALTTPHGSATGTASFTFGTPTSEIDKAVTVTDTFNGLTSTLGTVGYPGPGTFAYSRTVNVPTANCVTYPNTAELVETGQSASASVEVCAAQPTCSGAKINFRWHYSAGGSGSWSGTKSTSCDGSTLTMGPQAMEGDLKLVPGTTLKAGYDFAIPGNRTTLTLTVNKPQVVFTLRCVSGASPSQSSLTLPMSTAMYTIGDSAWYPSGDQHSALVYQGSATVPNVCGGGQVRLDKGGTLTATVT